MGPHSLLLTGSSGRPRAATKRTAPADRKQTRDYRRLPESRAVGRTRGGPSARIFPPTTRATAGEHGLRAGVGPLRNNVIHATAHGTWAVTRRHCTQMVAGSGFKRQPSCDQGTTARPRPDQRVAARPYHPYRCATRFSWPGERARLGQKRETARAAPHEKSRPFPVAEACFGYFCNRHVLKMQLLSRDFVRDPLVGPAAIAPAHKNGGSAPRPLVTGASCSGYLIPLS